MNPVAGYTDLATQGIGLGALVCTYAVLWLSACENGSASPHALVAHNLWAFVEAKNDPFAAHHRTDDIPCQEADVRIESTGQETALEIRTGPCNWLTVMQPSRVAIHAEDALDIRIWHQELQAPVATHATLAVQLGTATIWSHRQAIPSASGLISHGPSISDAYPQGTPLYFHLRNHGINSWSLIAIEKR